MNFTLNLWEVLTLVGTVTATFLALGRMFIAQAEKKVDERFIGLSRQTAQIDANARQTDQRLMQLLADLPVQYQRREDAIRQEVAIIARLDALNEKMMRILECNAMQCPARNEVTHEH